MSVNSDFLSFAIAKVKNDKYIVLGCQVTYLAICNNLYTLEK